MYRVCQEVGGSTLGRVFGGRGLALVARAVGKYGARRTEYRGIVYASAAEATYAADLNAKMADGKILDWHRPGPIVLVDGPKAADRITYTPDFLVQLAPDAWEWVEVKGVETPAWRLKLKLWKAFGPPRPLRIVYGDGREVVIVSRRAA